MGKKSTRLYNDVSAKLGETKEEFSKCREKLAYFDNEFKSFLKELSSDRKKIIYDHMTGVSFVLNESFKKISRIFTDTLVELAIFRTFLWAKAEELKNDQNRLKKSSWEKHSAYVDKTTADLKRMKAEIDMGKDDVDATLDYCKGLI